MAATEKVTDWPAVFEALTGWVPITGVTAGERVVTAAFGPSSELPPSEGVTALTLTKYSVPSAMPGKLLDVIVAVVPSTPTITTLGSPVPGES